MERSLFSRMPKAARCEQRTLMGYFVAPYPQTIKGGTSTSMACGLTIILERAVSRDMDDLVVSYLPFYRHGLESPLAALCKFTPCEDGCSRL